MPALNIPTEPIGSIPRPPRLIEAIGASPNPQGDPAIERLYDAAVADTIAQFEATGSPVLTDGEQRKYHNFWTYSVNGSPTVAPDGFIIPFAAGHSRRMPKLIARPFRYNRYADEYLALARRFTTRPLKQAVISASALSLLYPAEGVPGYSREEFLTDLINEHIKEVRKCLAQGAVNVQVDFTEGRLAMKIDPTGVLLTRFVELNNLALGQLTSEERARLGVHTCPGGDLDSTHSADVDYAELLPSLFTLDVTNFYIALAAETDRQYVLRQIRDRLKPHQRAFVGVISPIDPRIESPAEVRDRVLEAARYIPLAQLGTTDDCGFAPFSDDRSTSRETAFAKIRARVEGTALAARELGAGIAE